MNYKEWDAATKREFGYMNTLWFALLPNRLKEKVMARKFNKRINNQNNYYRCNDPDTAAMFPDVHLLEGCPIHRPMRGYDYGS